MKTASYTAWTGGGSLWGDRIRRRELPAGLKLDKLDFDCEGNPILERQVERHYFVNLVLEDRSYGGSEEGGWWYNTQEPTPHGWDAEFRTLEAAQAYRALYEDQIVAELNVGRRDISSVLSQGRYAVVITKDTSAEVYPSHRPYYE
jgi:hypothetical protein